MKKPVVFAVCLGFGAALLLYFLQRDVRLDWADEGFLWYGVRQMAHGQVPIRDFQSYDPGRYYWCHWFSPLAGGGIFGLRFAAALFQGIGLSFAALSFCRVLKSRLSIALAVCMAALWQFWFFRLFDSSYSMITLFFALWLLENPSLKRHIVCGIFTGFTVWFGTNHALYALAAFSLLSLFIQVKGALPQSLPKRAGFAIGALAGMLPVWIMALRIPGFWQNYCRCFGLLWANLSSGATDVRGNILWPWTIHWHDTLFKSLNFGIGLLQCVNLGAQSAVFVLLVLFYLVAAFAIARLRGTELRTQALGIAAFFVGVPYLHHVFSRGDITHLGEGIFPMIAGMVAFSKPRRPLASFMLVLTLCGALPLGNLFFKAFVPRGKLVHYRIGEDRIWVFQNDARFADFIKKLVAEHVPPNETIFLAPIYSTVYCVLDKPSPTYKIFFFKPDAEKEQQRTIRELEDSGVNWALVGDIALDAREELRFSHSQRSVALYLRSHFEQIPVPGLPGDYYFMRRSLKATR